MVTLDVAAPTGIASPPSGHFGFWHAVCSVPSIVGSVLVLLVLFGWTGQWEGPLLLTWIVAGSAAMTRTGERLALRFGAGFRRPTADQAALLDPVWTAALARCGLTRSHVDLCVQRSEDFNAFAAGRRSVAVTTGVLTRVHARLLPADHLAAVLVHELGHHATRATKFAVVTMWLAAPWRFVSRLVIGIGLATVGRIQPQRLLPVVVFAGMAIAVVQAERQGEWQVAALLGAIGFCAVACPLADAAVSRRSEYSADRYVAAVGLGSQLAVALKAMSVLSPRRRSLPSRLLSHHPDINRRSTALAALPVSAYSPDK